MTYTRKSQPSSNAIRWRRKTVDKTKNEWKKKKNDDDDNASRDWRRGGGRREVTYYTEVYTYL